MMESISNVLRVLLLIASTVAVVSQLNAQEGSINEPQPPTASLAAPDSSTDALQGEVSTLIEQLASTSFQTREAATSRLMEIGQAALGQLKLVTSRDFEVHYRAELVAAKIENERFQVLSRSFLLDPAPENSYGLPAWKPFSKLVGHSRTSKLLFLDMIRLHPELVATIDKLDKAELTQDGEQQRPDLFKFERSLADIAARLAANRITQMQVPEIGDFTAILFGSSFIEGQAPVEVNELLGMNAYLVPVSTYMRRRGYGAALQRLYGAWLPKSHAAMAYRAIGISLQYGLESGVELARNNLATNLDVRTREQAVHCIARFGNATDIARLVPLLDDEQVCQEFAGEPIPLSLRERIDESDEPPPGIPDQQKALAAILNGSQVRINDLALAAICILAEEEPESIFPGFVRNEIYVFDSRSIAVAKEPISQSERRRLIDEWKRRFSANQG